jgi:hypothetical protein
MYWVDTDLLNGVEEAQRPAKVQAILGQMTGRKHILVRLEPVRDSEAEVKGYMAFTQPR